MDAAAAAAAVNTTTFEPSFDLIQEDDCNTLLLYLPGIVVMKFIRNRVLKISGRRPLGNNRWSSFQKDFPVLESCDTNKISAKFEDGILYVRQPKEDKNLAAVAATQPPQKPAEEARPPLPPPAKIVPPPLPPAKLPTPTPTKTPALTPDHNREITAPIDPLSKPIHPSKDDIRSGERESRRKDERGHAAEGSGGGGDRKEKGAGSSGGIGGGAAKVEADYTKLSAESPAARLKAARKKVTNVMVLLFVFALGIYVSKLPWFSKSEQN